MQKTALEDYFDCIMLISVVCIN